MTTAVQTLITGPMLALYPPPQHLRGDAQQQAAALAAYDKALARFDAATLAAGWELVTAKHQFWVWPNPGTLAEACRRCEPPRPAASDQGERRQRADAMAETYAAKFMRSTHLAKLAQAEGWAGRLAEYVRDAAWVQAQLICGLSRVSFASSLVPAECRHLSAGEFIAGYRESVAGVLGRGVVRVTVPPSRIRGWKSCHAGSADRRRGPG